MFICLSYLEFNLLSSSFCRGYLLFSDIVVIYWATWFFILVTIETNTGFIWNTIFGVQIGASQERNTSFLINKWADRPLQPRPTPHLLALWHSCFSHPIKADLTYQFTLLKHLPGQPPLQGRSLSLCHCYTPWKSADASCLEQHKITN